MSITVPGSWRSLDVRPRYSERHVTMLLPLAMWGIEPDRPAPTPDYRKGSDQRPSDLPAMLADMQQSWRRSWMTLSMRRAVYVHLALDLPQHEGAIAMGFSQQTLSNHYRAGINALLSHLNGGVFNE